MKKTASLLLLMLLFITHAAEVGVSADKITLGQSCALTGPAKALGEGMKTGLNCYFSKVNEAGGINGRKITLISKDDGYEPDRALANTKALVETDKVFALIGEVGTPTSQAVVPYTISNNVPFIAPFTGAEFLRNPFKKNVINLRGSYYQEMEALTEHLVTKMGKKRIACFFQFDGYGKAGLNGLTIALAKRGLKVVSQGAYQRNTVDVEKGLETIMVGNPDAIVMVGAYKPCAAFIKKAEAKKAGITYCNISFVGTSALINELAGAGEGSLISQVVSFPWDASSALIKEYTADMTKYVSADKIDFGTLEGYMAGKLFCEILKNVQGDPTRDSFIAAMEKKGTFDLGGVTLKFGPKDHQGMESIFITQIKNKKITQVK